MKSKVGCLWVAAFFLFFLFACASGPPRRAVQTIRPLEGNIMSVNEKAKTLTLQTTMGAKETLIFNDETRVTLQGARRAISDIKTLEGVRANYIVLPDGTLLIKDIVISYSVARCNCRNCQCPITKGCRVIRY
ncbi:MAG: hypothetical protein AAB724_01310 [Patescibacteria group bacterium]